MSNRKYESGYEKLKKKRRIEKLIQSQHGALDKFFISSKKDSTSCSIKDNKELDVDFENELRDDVDVEKQLENEEGDDIENELDLLGVILK